MSMLSFAYSLAVARVSERDRNPTVREGGRLNMRSRDFTLADARVSDSWPTLADARVSDSWPTLADARVSDSWSTLANARVSDPAY